MVPPVSSRCSAWGVGVVGRARIWNPATACWRTSSHLLVENGRFHSTLSSNPLCDALQTAKNVVLLAGCWWRFCVVFLFSKVFSFFLPGLCRGGSCRVVSRHPGSTGTQRHRTERPCTVRQCFSVSLLFAIPLLSSFGPLLNGSPSFVNIPQIDTVHVGAPMLFVPQRYGANEFRVGFGVPPLGASLPPPPPPPPRVAHFVLASQSPRPHFCPPPPPPPPPSPALVVAAPWRAVRAAMACSAGASAPLEASRGGGRWMSFPKQCLHMGVWRSIT